MDSSLHGGEVDSLWVYRYKQANNFECYKGNKKRYHKREVQQLYQNIKLTIVWNTFVHLNNESFIKY